MLKKLFSLPLLPLFLIFAGLRPVSAATDPQDAAALTSLMKEWSNVPPSWSKSGDPCGDHWEGVSCSNSRVIQLKLFSMGIKGTLSPEIGKLSQLQLLDLSSNPDLGGTFPATIGNLLQLQTLRIIGCKFSGSIPDEIGKLLQLTYLAMNLNQFTGRLPPSVGNLKNIYWLDFSDNQLSGDLPVSARYGTGLDQLQNAVHFHLNKNQFTGVIPETMFSSNMKIRHILLDYNQLTGSVPKSIGTIGASLEVLQLNDNSLDGTVLANISSLPKLHVLNLANNKLHGPMPDLTGMTGLRVVNFSNNNFNPSVAPTWLTSLPRIRTLAIESGGLQGQVPQNLLYFSSFLQKVVLSNNSFNGTLDMGSSSISPNLTVVDLQNNNLASVTLSPGYNNSLMLAGNPLCGNLWISGTALCQPQQDTPPPTDGSGDNSCEHPFEIRLVFSAPFFSNPADFVPQLGSNLTATLSSCTPNTMSMPSKRFDKNGYLNVEVKACPVGKKFFNRSEVISCFDLSSYSPPEEFGPSYGDSKPYSFDNPVNIGLIIGIAVGSAVLIVGLVLVAVYAVRQRRRAQRALSLSNPFASWGSTGEDGGEAPRVRWAKNFSYEELSRSTNDFKEINVIGSGGYGKVYRGMLPDGQIVAIKRSGKGSMQGGLEFKTEIELLSRVHHKNLVGLVGFCFDKGERMLVYEFVANGSLSHNLSGMVNQVLNWSMRLRIARDAARGLAYLHDHANPPIIHRDVKSANILLDESFTAKVADFGLSLLVADSEEVLMATHVKGTLGYLDPEYFLTQQLTAKSDVFSFGVVMLELITGKPPIVDKKYVVTEVQRAADENATDGYSGLRRLIDLALVGAGQRLTGFKEYVALALRCVQQSPEDRPSMNGVVKAIEDIMQGGAGAKANPVLRFPSSIGAELDVRVSISGSRSRTMNSRLFEYSGSYRLGSNVEMSSSSETLRRS